MKEILNFSSPTCTWNGEAKSLHLFSDHFKSSQCLALVNKNSWGSSFEGWKILTHEVSRLGENKDVLKELLFSTSAESITKAYLYVRINVAKQNNVGKKQYLLKLTIEVKDDNVSNENVQELTMKCLQSVILLFMSNIGKNNIDFILNETFIPFKKKLVECSFIFFNAPNPHFLITVGL